MNKRIQIKKLKQENAELKTKIKMEQEEEIKQASLQEENLREIEDLDRYLNSI